MLIWLLQCYQATQKSSLRSPFGPSLSAKLLLCCNISRCQLCMPSLAFQPTSFEEALWALQWGSSKIKFDSFLNIRVITHLKILEESGNSKVVGEKSGKIGLEKINETINIRHICTLVYSLCFTSVNLCLPYWPVLCEWHTNGMHLVADNSWHFGGMISFARNLGICLHMCAMKTL